VDEDGVCGDVDLCPDVYDPDQVDTDGDGIGDLCDEDTKSGDDDGSCGCSILGARRSGTPHLLVLCLLLGLTILRRRHI